MSTFFPFVDEKKEKWSLFFFFFGLAFSLFDGDKFMRKCLILIFYESDEKPFRR